ncbi:transcriptional regulator [Streptomyces chrestomyceticus JCM 4735]|uniref:Transcriptional regulator n=1 Tax=Streptomyces chrestomyceticus JCM 4735 TaxID=1306181 RepID=A0A7U9Q4S4_9ACTN|nr:GAF and ANTAR domain-containing protein [Streptomyces chrestomyceticus]GCD39729.1 transcriptional regulator [Streptomyces chrestomyceticus JCM 4735]
MSASDREESLIAALLELADPATGPGATNPVERLAEYCVRLPGVQAGGVLMARDRQPALTVGFGDAAARLERVEAALDEGPCRDAWRTGRRLTDVPLSHPDCRARWPRFTTQALDEGFSAATALPVRYRSRRLGSLNFFHQHRALARREVTTGQALADAVAIGLAYRRDLRELRVRSGQLQAALDSRVIIEQAKGALAERQDRTPDEAFQVMRGYARAHQRKLTEVARQVLDGPAESGPFARPAPR